MVHLYICNSTVYKKPENNYIPLPKIIDLFTLEGIFVILLFIKYCIDKNTII